MDYPRPFLTQEEVHERMEALGFTFDPNYHLPSDGQVKQFVALQEIIAGAIAEWSDARPEGDDETWGSYDNELQEWAQEWMVG
jgi:hypothetical protein